YENYEEVLLTTAPGFISELGGQSSLFVGVSLLTVVQVVVAVALWSTKRVKKVRAYVCDWLSGSE
ncbi:hypothetical protein AAVH_41391, partial [Aphelenchoides avenae]